ncbi:chitinase-3-like protein 2 isoform X2 [Osmia bicornis bicornis]|uniref:chitinase-3-like protein 2 isoform X2 n=1 Tax=Osmia bicornis bicornis TaxID=1437191 RepID=UPI001EAF5004|nr:chitinase-3-like protein 2 isoform X2 [Osmia bicornis bicornis]
MFILFFRPRWKSQILCLLLVSLVFAILFVSRAWIGIVILRSSRAETFDTETLVDNAKIATWLRRARMYAESTKENQNADRNNSISSPQRYSTNSSGQILVCYYTIQSNLNTFWELSPSHVDPNLCTHIIVGFASVVNCSLDLGSNSSIYKDILALKKLQPELRVMISAGGSNELHLGFSEMVKNHLNRKRFIKSVLNVTKTFGFDGLDLDWEFPAWLGADDREKIHFIQLLEELRKEFYRAKESLILSVAVAAPQAIVDQSYDVVEMAKYVDFVNLMSYDYHFYVWYYPITDLNAPLYPRLAESGYLSTLNVNFSTQYWLSKGMPREKLIIGIPTYGHSYRLDNPLNRGLLAPANGFGKLGKMGFVSYYTVCQFLHDGAKSVFDDESKVPYAYKDREWISYDDVTSVYYKAEWIRANNFGGAMILSLNVDDWNNTCKFNETFPLTRTVTKVLRYREY